MPDNPAGTVDPNEQMISAILNAAGNGAPIATQGSPLPNTLQAPAPAAAAPAPQQPPAPDLGTGNLNEPSGIGPTPKAAPSGPPKQSMVPALAGFLQQMIGGQNQRGYYDAPAGQPGRPVSRLDAFENFLGNFLSSFSAGMQQGGTGPGAWGRGFGAAVNAPYQKQVGQYQMQQQAQLEQAQAQEAAGRGAESQARATQMGQMITLPNGMSMPLALAQKVYPAMLAGQAKVQAAGVQKRFMSTPYGIYDTQKQEYAGGSGAGMRGTVTITPEMAEDAPMLKDLVGTKQKITDVSSAFKGEASLFTPTQGAQGPGIMRKTLPEGVNAASAGLGSPATNWLAVNKQNLVQRKYGDVLNSLSPAAQSVLQQTVPTHDQISDLKRQFESMKDDDTPFKFAPERAMYAIGVDSPIGKASDTIAQLELNKITGAARVLKGGSRAIEALNLAMGHLPNVWKDSPKLIYSKLDNLDKALTQIEDAAQTYGTKSGLTPKTPSTGGGAGKGALSESEATEYLRKAGNNPALARKMAKADGRSF